MSYQIELQDKSTVEKDMIISIERNAFDGKYEKQLSRIASQAHLKGFRPGKAPKDMVKKTYGSKIYEEVLNEFVNEALRETITKNKLPILETNISQFSQGEKDGDPVTVNLTLSLYPEPKIEKYKGLRVEYKVSPFSSDAVDMRIERLREMLAETNDVTDETVPAKDKDIVTIDYVAKFEGNKDDNLSANGQTIELGQHQLPEELEKVIVGMKLGETKTTSYTFPDTAAEELKGKTYELEITLVKLQEKKLPELNDEFAKRTSLGEDLASLREYLEKQVKNSVDSSNQESRDTAIIDAVVKENDFELPQVLIDREIRNLLAEMRVLNPKDKNFETAPVAEYRHILSDRASERIKRYIVIEELLKAEAIDPNDDDVETFLDDVARKESRTRDEINKDFSYPKNKDAIKRMAGITTLFEKISADTELVAVEAKKEEK